MAKHFKHGLDTSKVYIFRIIINMNAVFYAFL